MVIVRHGDVGIVVFCLVPSCFYVRYHVGVFLFEVCQGLVHMKVIPVDPLILQVWVSIPFDQVLCYVLGERSARLELDGYDSVVWHVVLEACASSTL